MSYRFEGNESAADAVERIALEQLDKALEHTKAKTKLDDAGPRPQTFAAASPIIVSNHFTKARTFVPVRRPEG